ncbi:MAG: serine/threonine protein kinase [Actinobacteria bacterium]|nr:serine/threonine protein kinase [Actinomycetota bacterium]
MTVPRTRVLGGRYALGEVLGTGGMATVWRATDEVLGRDVAVKVLSPQYAADAEFVARFEREARHAARLSHPRLVTVFDCGVDDGVAFIVMELAAGRTLRQVLDDLGALPPAEAVRIAAAVCEALEVAHAAGLVHRDIKPANIVVSGGDTKVVDFGIARADGLVGGTRTAGVLGTAAYLSPEQALDRPAGPQSDLYSLGCVLFEMLAGSPPFTADSAVALAYRHVHDDPGSPSARTPGIPSQLDLITAQLLAKDPAGRPPSAAAARASLLAALNPDDTAVLAITGNVLGAGGLGGLRRRRPTRPEIVLAGALAAALAALAAVLLTGAIGGATSGPTAGDSPGAGKSAAASASAQPPVAAAAATFIVDLQAGVSDGQVSQSAGQDLYNQLEKLVVTPPGRDPLKIQQDYAQLLQSYDQHSLQGDITGQASVALGDALQVLGAAVRAG